MKKLIPWIGLFFVVGCNDRHNDNPAPELSDDRVSHDSIYDDDIFKVELFSQADVPSYRSLGVYYQVDSFDVHLDFFIRKVPDASGDLFLYYRHPHQDFRWSARIKAPEEIELQAIWWNGERIYPPDEGSEQ